MAYFDEKKVICLMVFAWCPLSVQCEIHNLEGSLLWIPQVPKSGEEVIAVCKCFLDEESQKNLIAVDIDVKAADGRTVETSKNTSAAFLDRQQDRWVTERNVSFTARTEDGPVTVKCFYKLNNNPETHRLQSIADPIWALTIEVASSIIQILDPPVVEQYGRCDDQRPDNCALRCQISHLGSIRVVPGSCNWRYRPSVDAPSIIIPMPDTDCRTMDGRNDEMTISLARDGVYAGNYLCHAEYKYLKVFNTYQVNYLVMKEKTGQVSDLNGPCASKQDCKTYRATCVKSDGAEKGTCQCVNRYPNVQIKRWMDQDYVTACYGEEGPPQDGSSALTTGILPVAAALVVCLLTNHHY